MTPSMNMRDSDRNSIHGTLRSASATTNRKAVVMSADIKYPLRIRFWYWLYDTAERLSDWTHREKIKPWHDAHKLPLISPTYHLLKAIDPTPDERKRGITATKIYVSDKP